MEDDDEFDDFLFDSIRRYNTLQMFNLENVPHHLIRLNDTSICVVSQRDKGNNSEILRLQLPKKLSLPPNEEGRSKENDFKVLSGAYTESTVHTADKLNYDNKILTSEANVMGLKIYDFDKKPFGSNTQVQGIDIVPWTSSNFVVMKSTNVALCSKSEEDPLLLVDMETNKIIQKVKLTSTEPQSVKNESENKGNIKCEVFHNNSIVILNSLSGDIKVHDLKSDSRIKNIPGPDERNIKPLWNISKHDSSDYKQINHFGILSNSNQFALFDIRNLNKIFENFENNSLPKSVDVDKLKFKFSEKEVKFSISGLDSNVNVFSFDEAKFDHLFTHNGHSPGDSKNRIVTDHIWLPIGHRELVVSICDNKTLNCWEFNVN